VLIKGKRVRIKNRNSEEVMSRIKALALQVAKKYNNKELEAHAHRDKPQGKALL